MQQTITGQRREARFQREIQSSSRKVHNPAQLQRQLQTVSFLLFYELPCRPIPFRTFLTKPSKRCLRCHLHQNIRNRQRYRIQPQLRRKKKCRYSIICFNCVSKDKYSMLKNGNKPVLSSVSSKSRITHLINFFATDICSMKLTSENSYLNRTGRRE